MYKKLFRKNIFNQLNESTLENTKKFSLDGKKKYCKVVKVYDGDTITINMFLKKKLYQFSVRMFGYNSPEIRTSDPDEKKAGYTARDYLAEQILDKIVFIQCGGFDKYGRLLGEIFLSKKDVKSKKSINNLMVEQNHGEIYHV